MDHEEIRSSLVRHHAESFGWALHCARFDRPEAEETLQTAYLKVLEGRARFDGRAAFRTWLFGVIRRTAQERRRNRVLREVLLDRWRSRRSWHSASPGEPLALLLRDDQARTLADALGRLSGRQRDVLHLVFYQDLSIAEAAGVMGLGLGTARTHYERGKARLRALLAGDTP